VGTRKVVWVRKNQKHIVIKTLFMCSSGRY
jgi:hypothetical protein